MKRDASSAISLIIILFSFLEPLPAFSEEKNQSSKSLEKSALAPSNLFQIQFPENAALLNEIWTPPKGTKKSDSIIIYIQDAHCQFEAQINIAKLLEKLIKTYSIPLVAVEGTAGIIDTSALSEFQDEKVKETVIKYFINRGKITGPEYLSIMKKCSFALFGIEDEKLYDANLRAFKKVLPERKLLSERCDKLIEVLDILKIHIFSSELLAFDQAIQNYKNGKLSFSSFCDVLEKTIEKNKKINLTTLKNQFTNFYGLFESIKFESKLNIKSLESEQKHLMQRLSKILSKEQLSELVGISLQVRLGKISQPRYYRVLENILTKTQGHPSLSTWKRDYPEIVKYMDYSRKYEAIDKEKAFEEIDLIMSDVLEFLFQSEDQKTLYFHSKNMNILKKLFLLELSRKELKYFQKHKSEFKVVSLMNFIEDKAKTYAVKSLESLSKESFKNLDDFQDSAEHFYRIAHLRDITLLENTIKAMKNHNSSIAILITGGYHTEGIKEILRSRAIPYVLFSPRITHEQPNNPYIEVLTQQRSAFEDFLSNVEGRD